MVLSLSIPGLSPKPATQRRTTSRSSSSTLSEALRTNPFGTKSQLQAKSEDHEHGRQELNATLLTVAALFPDVQVEVLRELLVRFEGESRLEISVEQLMKYKAEWVKGRWNAPPTEPGQGIPLNELFRSEDYKKNVKANLYTEFRGLSRSVVDAVSAENNFSYTRARPVLQELSKKTWRAAIGNLIMFRKRKERDEPPVHLVEAAPASSREPTIKKTGCAELDEELHGLFFSPAVQFKRAEQEAADQDLAEALNRTEAEEAGAVYECDCCCSDTTFEYMSTCMNGSHMICHDCIRGTVHEALFGQGWSKSIDAEKGTLKCLAPLVGAVCDGFILHDTVRQAVRADKGGDETWLKFEDRLATEALLKSQIKLVRCSSCSYAEADPASTRFSGYGRPWRLRPLNDLNTILNLMLFIDFLPLLLFLVAIASIVNYTGPRTILETAVQNLSLRRRSPRFTCRSPSCGRKTCLKCSKAWHDPHICHEPLFDSLRTTVEAARTAAIKRTCPRCGLSFVKASGCNKLTCICGYTMCYVCRKALGSPGDSGGTGTRGGNGGHEELEGGYRHFCEHFRVNPGKPCTECRKCDLYRAEDEDVVVRRAGEMAEREWRTREGMVGVEGFSAMQMHGDDTKAENRIWAVVLRSRRWTLQHLVDCAVGAVIEVEM